MRKAATRTMLWMLVLGAGITAHATAQNAITGTDRGGEFGSQQLQESTGDFAIRGMLTVRNCTGYFVEVYVNESYRGTLEPYQSDSVFVGDSRGTMTCLQAEAPGVSISWHSDVYGDYSSYTWSLYG